MIDFEDYTEDNQVQDYVLECEDRAEMYVLYYALYKLIQSPMIGDPLTERPLTKKGYGKAIDWLIELQDALEKR